MSIFYDSNFEGTITGDGWSAPTRPAQQFITTEAALTDTHCLKGVWVDTGGLTTSSMERYHTQTTHVFYRIPVRRDPNFQMSTNFHSKLFQFTGINTYPRCWLYLTGGSFIFEVWVEVAYDIADTLILSTGVPSTTATFSQVEIEFLLNTPGVANGEARVWVNGTMTNQLTGRQWVGPTPTSTNNFNTGGLPTHSDMTWTFNQLYVQSGLGYVYFDRIAAGDTRLFTVGGGPDVTAPAIPTGVTVT